jgi:mono/diheme cytochrome c family protein
MTVGQWRLEMTRYVLVAFMGLALTAGAAGAQTTPKIEKGPIKPTKVDDASAMFHTYCAVCHGNDGTGGGPAAKALTKVPADLTKLSARNNGTFPGVKVRRYIEGVDDVAAHGTRDMPMWGDLFRSLGRDTAQIRIEALAEYLQAMQK